MRLQRTQRPLPAVSIVPLIDVLLILLVFFMVTSTFLDLDMLPLVGSGQEAGPDEQSTTTLLIRIQPDGAIVHAGRSLTDAAAAELMREHAARPSAARLLVLPSAQSDVAAFVGVLDMARDIGIDDVSVLRFGGGQ